MHKRNYTFYVVVAVLNGGDLHCRHGLEFLTIKKLKPESFSRGFKTKILVMFRDRTQNKMNSLNPSNRVVLIFSQMARMLDTLEDCIQDRKHSYERSVDFHGFPFHCDTTVVDRRSIGTVQVLTTMSMCQKRQ